MNVDILIPNLQLSQAALAALPKSATVEPASLAALLNKSRKTETQAATRGSFPWLLKEFKVPEDAQNLDISSLFVTAEIDANRLHSAAVDHIWLVAEPVYLKPDRDALALFRGAHLEISCAEATALTNTLNQHFAQDGLLFAAATPSRWYVQCPVNRVPSASSPSWIAARGELFTHMPVSIAGGINWRAILNEVQMLLHNHAVNEEREARGFAAINGVWIFGSATQVSMVDKSPYDAVYSSNFETLALASFHKLKCLETVDNWASTTFTSNSLVYINALESIAIEEDFSRWQHAREALEYGVFSPFLQKLERGEISRLRVIDAHTTTTTIYTIAPFSFNAFFKRLFGSKQ